MIEQQFSESLMKVRKNGEVSQSLVILPNLTRLPRISFDLFSFSVLEYYLRLR